MSKYTDIIERLNNATGPGRELDARICAVDGLEFGFCDGVEFRCRECCNGIEPPTDGCDNPVGLYDERTSYPSKWQDDERLPHYTNSIDACIALIERVLPIASVEMASIDTGFGIIHKAAIRTRVITVAAIGESHHSLPIALLIALFTALEAKESL